MLFCLPTTPLLLHLALICCCVLLRAHHLYNLCARKSQEMSALIILHFGMQQAAALPAVVLPQCHYNILFIVSVHRLLSVYFPQLSQNPHTCTSPAKPCLVVSILILSQMFLPGERDTYWNFSNVVVFRLVRRPNLDLQPMCISQLHIIVTF